MMTLDAHQYLIAGNIGDLALTCRLFDSLFGSIITPAYLRETEAT